MKKWIVPILYFCFGMLVFLGETLVFKYMDEVSIDFRLLVNHTNTFIFTLIPIILFGYLYKKQIVSFRFEKGSILFLAYNILGLIFTSLYWINTIKWR